MVAVANAVAHPRAVVIHLQHTSPADGAMMAAVGLDALTGAARAHCRRGVSVSLAAVGVGHPLSTRAHLVSQRWSCQLRSWRDAPQLGP